ncbi:MAG TPA: hypothetical protein VJP40_00255, partial [bacterium]|nr:hypothetical protein [bacterium]
MIEIERTKGQLWQLLWILPFASLVWGLSGYLKLGAGQYPIWVSAPPLLAMALAFYGLFLLPPLLLFLRAGRGLRHNPLFSSRRILL